MFDELPKRTMPKVSVVLPTYGCSKYLSESIESILGQTLQDIELIIVEDPKDGRFENEAIVEKYKHDPRIRYFNNEHREGLVNSLNKGISIAKADYIARQDGDDVSLPDRLLLQHEFLKGTDGAVVGGNIIFINDDGETKGYRKYPKIVKGKAMLLSNLVAHPTVMFDKKAILSLGGYNSEMVHVEDYELWLRLIDKGYKIYNLSTYLIRYRHHKEALKYKVFKKSVLNTIKLQIMAIRQYKNVGYNILFPIYFFAEIFVLILPKRVGYFLSEKLSVRSSY
jgi:glycosyltransferase involved in cell wall biosynthesis